MKIAVIIVRVLLGLLFLFASVAFFFKLIPQPEVHGDMLAFNKGLEASGYIMTFVKVIELLCGLAFVIGFFVPLATIVIFPITINIFMVHLILAPEGIIMATLVLLFNLFLAYAYRKHYADIFATKGEIS